MKKDIQPKYGKATIRCVCGKVKNKQYLAKVELLNSWKNTEFKQNNNIEIMEHLIGVLFFVL